MGLFLNSIPMLFKKKQSYQEMGVILMCTMHFSFKVLWSPLVELYHIKALGKRKTWVVTMQLAGCAILFYLSGSIEEMLHTKQVYRLLVLLMLNTFIITCQDIAVDSWAVDMLAAENSSYGSSSQSVGHKVGSIISTTVFIALNSVEFCNKYIYESEQSEPLVSISSFIWWWSSFQLLTTLYILVFVRETEQSSSPDEEELEIGFSMAPSIFIDILKKREIQVFFLFQLITCSANTINNTMAQVYLTDELKFPIGSLSQLKLVSTPANLLCSILSGYLTSLRPFRCMFMCTFA